MARAVVVTQTVVRAGLAPVLTTPTVDGDSIESGSVAVMVTNGSGAPINVTVQTPATQAGLDVAELIVAVPAAGTKLIGPFPVGTFGQDDGRVYVNYSAQASVTRGVVGF